MDNENPLDATTAEFDQIEAPAVLTVSAVEAIERAEVDIAIATAKRYPRDLGLVKREMKEMATKDPKVAASCTYKLPRGGKEITGPSIRMAEIVFSCFGNLNAGTRVVAMGDDIVTCQAVCHDLQKNNRLALEIPRNVYPSKKAKTDEEKAAALRDARHLAALAGSKIAFREAIFGIVPRSLVTPVWQEAQEVAAGRGRSFDDARAACFEEFKKIRVSPKQICDYLEIGGIESLTTGHLQLLFAVLTSINDGETTVEAEFGPREKTSKAPVKAEVPEPKTTAAAAETKPDQPETKPAKTEAPKSLADDFYPELASAKKPPAPAAAKKAKAAPEPEAPQLDPVYSRVAKKIQESGISLEDFFRVLRFWGITAADAKSLTDVRLGAMRTVENDWQAVLDELAMNPKEAA
jgi:hypothetical protein